MNRATILFAIAGVMFACTAPAASILFQDLDPVTAPNQAREGLIVNTVDASGLTGDPARTAVGDVILEGSNKFVGVNPGGLPITPANHGQPYTLTLDYFVPTGTTLDDNSGDGSSPDLFWLQADFNGVNVGQSIGFIGAGEAGMGWKTLTLQGTVPANVGPNPTDSITPLFVMADGGFGAGTPNGTGAGTALFIDNMILEVDEIPEPVSLLLLGLGAAGLVIRRRH